jgi:hypothetical protein
MFIIIFYSEVFRNVITVYPVRTKRVLFQVLNCAACGMCGYASYIVLCGGVNIRCAICTKIVTALNARIIVTKSRYWYLPHVCCVKEQSFDRTQCYIIILLRVCGKCGRLISKCTWMKTVYIVSILNTRWMRMCVFVFVWVFIFYSIIFHTVL